jgi:large subunit ribosomal protein L31
MKASIHPNWKTITVTCVCGNTFESGSTKSAVSVDICAACHPFFTNEMRFVDRQGRVDKFRQRQALASGTPSAKKKAAQKAGETKSFKDILKSQKQAIVA